MARLRVSKEDQPRLAKLKAMLLEGLDYYRQSKYAIDSVEAWWTEVVGNDCYRWCTLRTDDHADDFLRPDLFLVNELFDIPIEYKHGLSTKHEEDKLVKQIRHLHRVKSIVPCNQKERNRKSEFIPLVIAHYREAVRAVSRLAQEEDLKETPVWECGKTEQGKRHQFTMAHRSGQYPKAFHSCKSGEHTLYDWIAKIGISVDAKRTMRVQRANRFFQDEVHPCYKVQTGYVVFHRATAGVCEITDSVEATLIDSIINKLAGNIEEKRLYVQCIDYCKDHGMIRVDGDELIWLTKPREELDLFAADVVARAMIREQIRTKKLLARKKAQEDRVAEKKAVAMSRTREYPLFEGVPDANGKTGRRKK